MDPAGSTARPTKVAAAGRWRGNFFALAGPDQGDDALLGATDAAPLESMVC